MCFLVSTLSGGTDCWNCMPWRLAGLMVCRICDHLQTNDWNPCHWPSYYQLPKCLPQGRKIFSLYHEIKSLPRVLCPTWRTGWSAGPPDLRSSANKWPGPMPLAILLSTPNCLPQGRKIFSLYHEIKSLPRVMCPTWRAGWSAGLPDRCPSANKRLEPMPLAILLSTPKMLTARSGNFFIIS